MRSTFMATLKSHEETKGFALKKITRELEEIQQIQLKDDTIQTITLTKIQILYNIKHLDT